MRIIIPILENKGIDSKVSSHFGRAPFFALYNSEKNELEIIENKSEHFGGIGRPTDILLKYKPDVIFAIGIGPRAVELLKSNNIRIETGDFQTVREIIENKDRLKKLEEVCKHSRRQI
ncbi:MAG: NifB/NifX family molybdenum-iron cluster-binding protein [Nitrososphaerota archaeon]